MNPARRRCVGILADRVRTGRKFISPECRGIFIAHKPLCHYAIEYSVYSMKGMTREARAELREFAS
jgi:hypothetical protein